MAMALCLVAWAVVYGWAQWGLPVLICVVLFPLCFLPPLFPTNDAPSVPMAMLSSPEPVARAV
jgi:hypothetical protein